jgi:hypothetical protein
VSLIILEPLKVKGEGLKDYEVEEFKRRYPNLARELEDGIGVRSMAELAEGAEPPFMPTAVDYLRRCRSLKEAFDVLEYLARTGQLSEEDKGSLREELMKGGLESLGPRREFGYYSERFLGEFREAP